MILLYLSLLKFVISCQVIKHYQKSHFHLLHSKAVVQKWNSGVDHPESMPAMKNCSLQGLPPCLSVLIINFNNKFYFSFTFFK